MLNITYLCKGEDMNNLRVINAEHGGYFYTICIMYKLEVL